VSPPAPPTATALARPSPNPAPHGSTSISYTLTGPERVELRVVDPTGRVVTVLEDGPRGAGTHAVTWDGRARGRTLPPGLYLVQLLTPSRSEIRRLVVL
jgi:flagellar hook assembly protein FlgD